MTGSNLVPFSELNIGCCFLAVQEPNVSMIITDYWMPEMTGYDLLKKVKVTKHSLSVSDGFFHKWHASTHYITLHLTQCASW